MHNHGFYDVLRYLSNIMYSHDCVSDDLWAQDYCYVVLELIIKIIIQKLLRAGKLIINCWEILSTEIIIAL